MSATSPLKFTIEKKLEGKLGRVGKLETPHGVIETPSFVVVGTKATVKSLTPEQLTSLGAQVVLANTYHLYLQPGDEILKKAGKIQKFMNWSGPTMTDSGGFQAFSLGAAFGKGLTKIASAKSNGSKADEADEQDGQEEPGTQDQPALAKITEDGVEFKSIIDGSKHIFTPEKSIGIQHNIGADMIFAFDECTSPHASHEYQKEAMDRTHRWAKRCIEYHQNQVERDADGKATQALLGIVQGGRFQDLREESARAIAAMDFDGFGIGGSFEKEDMDTAVGWVNALLPEDKPRHLLGIGEPLDLFGAVENGCDLFDCVAPTRIARNGSLYTKSGRINIFNAQFVEDFAPIEADCDCYTCQHYTKAYLSHLFRAKEILANTLASIHNLYFIIHLVKKMRATMLDGTFAEFKQEFIAGYYKQTPLAK